MNHQPETSNFESIVRKSFAKQSMMMHLGAEIYNVSPSSVEIRLPHRYERLQQHGLFHGGATTAILDTTGGYAAYSLFKPDEETLTVEYKVNFLAPVLGDQLVARAQVVKLGKNLSVTRGEAYAIKDG